MKVNYSYIESLIETAEKHEVEEYQFYRDRGRKVNNKTIRINTTQKWDRTTKRSNAKTVKK